MLKRVFASILVAAAFPLVLIKWLLSLADMASTLEFLRSHSPSFLRAFRKIKSQAVALVVGIVIGLWFHAIVPSTSQHQANPEVRRLEPVLKQERNRMSQAGRGKTTSRRC